jgi:hypothetical protein
MLAHFQVQSPYPDHLKQRDLINSFRRELQLLARRHPITAGDKSQPQNGRLGYLRRTVQAIHTPDTKSSEHAPKNLQK